MTQMSHLKLLNSLSILQECSQFNQMASNYATKLSKFESTTTIDGYSWTKKSEAVNHLSAYYNCKCYRGGCGAKLTVKIDGSTVMKGVHDCKQNGFIKKATIGEIYDAGPEIKQMIQDSSVEDVTKSVQSIARRVYSEIQEKHKGR
jgi:acyl CoA:acetate/3-ketoacid CoA transferase